MSRTPRRSRLVATIGRRGRFQVAEPLFERGGQIALARGTRGAREGEMALVELRGGGARVVERLGSPRAAADVAAALLAEHELRRGFSARLEDDARDAAARAAQDGPARRDLTALDTFTVDPATARDFDDAVSAQPEGDGIRIWVHIADVSAHVTPGSALDSEALERGNSTYVPGTVEPMLPAALSAGACSLNPGVERLAVTAEMVIGGDGEPRSASFYRSRIRSDARLDYDQLDRVFAGREPAPEAVAGPLHRAREAAAALAARRPVAALEIESFEPEFEFDADGHVMRAHGVEQTEAHRLIEHLMIATNERVAELLERRGTPTLYRVHEQPDPQRVELLVEQLDSLGIPTPPLPEQLSPRQASELVGEASRLVAREAERRGHGKAAYASLILRALKQAHYTHRNIGHAGLGSGAYCHFTSPIRRYPDLIAHRALLSALGEGESEPDPGEVREAGWRCSERERESMRAERRADRVCTAFLLERELFEHGWRRGFEGEVSGLIGAGAFVSFAGELADVYEGFLPVRRMPGERFDLNPQETALVGRRSGRELRLGDQLEVRVDGVEAPRGRVDLVPADGGGDRPRGGRR